MIPLLSLAVLLMFEFYDVTEEIKQKRPLPCEPGLSAYVSTDSKYDAAKGVFVHGTEKRFYCVG